MTNKFFANKVKYQGMTFDSEQELDRYIALKAMEIRGEVSRIHRQVKLTISPAVVRTEFIQMKTKIKEKRTVIQPARHYTADFVYRDNVKECIVIEDVKSSYTATLKDYILRRHLLLLKIQKHEREKKLARYQDCEDKRLRWKWVDLHRETFIFRECKVLKDDFETKDWELNPIIVDRRKIVS